MKLGFKELLRMDNETVFLNPDEFGEEHIISGRRMTIIIDDNEMIEREKRQISGREYRQGVFHKQILFYVSAKVFGVFSSGAKPDAGWENLHSDGCDQ